MRSAMLCVCLAAAGNLCAYEVGDKVVVVSEQAAIKVGVADVDHPPVGESLVVREINGNWLAVSRGWPGYINQQHVVAFDHALRFFNRRTVENRDASMLIGRAHHLSDLEKFDEAIADYTEAIRLIPNSSAALVGRGNAWSSKHEFERATKDYSEAIRHSHDSVIAYYDRGLSWTGRMQYERAIADYSSAIHLSPTYAKAYQLRGEAYLRLNDLDQAKADCEEALSRDPKSPGTFVLRGRIRRREGEFEKAVEDFEQAIRLAPKTGGVYIGLVSETFGVRGDYKRLKEYLERLSDSAPEAQRYDVLSQLASCCRSLREFEAALRYMEKAATLKPNDVSTLYNLAIMQKNAGRVEQALRSYERARDLTQSTSAKVNLDIVIAGYRIHAGRRDSGLELFELVKSDAERRGMFVNLAWFYAVARDDDRFYDALKRALSTYPESALDWIRTEVDIDEYREEPRFKAIVEKHSPAPE